MNFYNNGNEDHPGAEKKFFSDDPTQKNKSLQRNNLNNSLFNE